MAQYSDKNNFVTELQREYERIGEQWLVLHYRSIIAIIAIGLVVEMFLAYVYYDMVKATIEISFEAYVSKFMLRPLFMNLAWLSICLIGMHVRSISTRMRAYILSIALAGVCLVFYSVHYIFYLSLIMFAPILLTAFYSDYVLTSVVAAISLVAMTVSDLMILWDATMDYPLEAGYSLMRIVVSGLILAAFYALCMLIIFFQKRKNSAVMQIERERQRINLQLVTDPLTGTLNRVALRNIFPEIEGAASDSYFFAMMDVDYFKKLNDTYGHAKGDQCLVKIGSILKEHSSDDVLAFRYGGDEFCVLFKNKTIDEVRWTCTVICEEFKMEGFGGTDFPLTISVGIAQYKTGMFAEDLLREADQALYRAKNQKGSIAF